MDGLLLIDKPQGWTSFDVVNYVRSIIARSLGKKPRQVKVGHTGTLDPMATGLLVLCVGSYTKKVQDMIKHDKTYEAELTFGATSDTGDAEGVIERRAESEERSREQVEEVLRGFVGEIEQVPPAYSALKVNGKRAYELARAGKPVKLEPRKVTIHSIELVSYAWPNAHITCKVSSGTYIRTLAEDVGEKLGVGAYLSALRRTVVDKWNVESAIGPKELDSETIVSRLISS